MSELYRGDWELFSESRPDIGECVDIRFIWDDGFVDDEWGTFKWSGDVDWTFFPQPYLWRKYEEN